MNARHNPRHWNERRTVAALNEAGIKFETPSEWIAANSELVALDYRQASAWAKSDDVADRVRAVQRAAHSSWVRREAIINEAAGRTLPPRVAAFMAVCWEQGAAELQFQLDLSTAAGTDPQDDYLTQLKDLWCPVCGDFRRLVGGRIPAHLNNYLTRVAWCAGSEVPPVVEMAAA